MRLFVDSDACPVKEEVIKVAVRHGLPVTMIGNRWLRGVVADLFQDRRVSHEPARATALPAAEAMPRS